MFLTTVLVMVFSNTKVPQTMRLMHLLEMSFPGWGIHHTIM